MSEHIAKFIPVDKSKEIDFIYNGNNYTFRVNRESKESEGLIVDKSIRLLLSQINHLLWWLYNNRTVQCITRDGVVITVDGYDYIVQKIISLNMKLSSGILFQSSLNAVQDGQYDNIQEAKVDIYNKVIEFEFGDEIFINIIHNYVEMNSIKNVVPEKSMDYKLEPHDVHIIDCLSIILKLYYICHLRSTYSILYRNVARKLLIITGDTLDDLLLVDKPTYSFSDRYSLFVKFTNEACLKSSYDDANMFTLLGKDKTSVTDKCLKNTLDSLRKYSCCPVNKDWTVQTATCPINKESFYYNDAEYSRNPHMFDNLTVANDSCLIELFPGDFKFVQKNTVGWIQSTVQNTSKRETGLQCPGFLINVISSKTDLDGSSKSDRFEILLKKSDHAEYRRVMNKKKMILDKELSEMSDDIKNLYMLTVSAGTLGQHELNKLLVSMYLENIYDEDISPILSNKDFTLIAFRVYQRLLPIYPNLAKCVIGKKIEGVNNVTAPETNLLMEGIASTAMKKNIVDILRIKFSTTVGNVVSMQTVGEEFITFLNNGGII